MPLARVPVERAGGSPGRVRCHAPEPWELLARVSCAVRSAMYFAIAVAAGAAPCRAVAATAFHTSMFSSKETILPAFSHPVRQFDDDWTHILLRDIFYAIF